MSNRVMVSAVCARVFDDADLRCILDKCLQDFPNVKALRKEQEKCLIHPARGRDIFAILPTGFRKSLIFQLFPRLAKAVMKTEMSSIW